MGWHLRMNTKQTISITIGLIIVGVILGCALAYKIAGIKFIEKTILAGIQGYIYTRGQIGGLRR